MENNIVLFLAQALIFGGFCAFSAQEKNRNTIGWFALGFLFSVIALLSLIAIPNKYLDNITSNNLELDSNKDVNIKSNCTHEGEDGNYCTQCGSHLEI